jgi:hypothetical protein
MLAGRWELPSGFLITGYNDYPTGPGGSARIPLTTHFKRLGNGPIGVLTYDFEVLPFIAHTSTINLELVGRGIGYPISAVIPPNLTQLLGPATLVANFYRHPADDSDTVVFPFDGSDTHLVANWNGDYVIWSSQITFDISIGCGGALVTVRDGNGGLSLLVNFTFGYYDDITPITVPAIVYYSDADRVKLVIPSGMPPGNAWISGYLANGQEVNLGSFTVPSGCGPVVPVSAEASECGTRIAIATSDTMDPEDVHIVEFNGSGPILAEFIDDHLLFAFSPEHAPGVVDITIRHVQAGQSETIVDGFEFVATVPTILSIVPSLGTLAGGTAFTLHGTGFVPGMSILFDGVPATSVVFVDSTEYTGVTPAHQVGPVTVQIIAP